MQTYIHYVVYMACYLYSCMSAHSLPVKFNRIAYIIITTVLEMADAAGGASTNITQN